MVEIIGRHLSTEEQNGQLVDRWRLPALGERQARAEGVANARLKGRSSASVRRVREVEDGDLPGQTIYEVITEAER